MWIIFLILPIAHKSLSIEVFRFTIFQSFWFYIQPQTVPATRMNLLSVILALLAIIVGSINAVNLVPRKIQPPRVQTENVRYARSPAGLDHAGTLRQFQGSQTGRIFLISIYSLLKV
ncbi:unnamed protein product [Allacma fusca]|uniref:Uncharacterized protein n=1 Tax=Allacma fusca TaxID=39272 RepID=A0A8J2NXU0_9HEXA|nr:unnamed protein product [Allacma fusca]